MQILTKEKAIKDAKEMYTKEKQKTCVHKKRIKQKTKESCLQKKSLQSSWYFL